ncbi:FAD-dependent oxidoreductase [Sphingobium tyrosinilyticum]|uniref:FAD-dependent oxidoreductase n=1 Tax=Sphingobium tyrosinilyticum TaxID=2715436 RepID=A0ABV9EYB0_9SPHN
MAFTHVDTPISIGNVHLKNRIFRPAHAVGVGAGNMNEALIAYHEERAKGGAALSILEAGSVHASTAATLNIFEPSIEGGMRTLIARCKPHGMKLFQQLWHAGHHVVPADGTPPWSASDVPSIVNGLMPVPMTKTMIDTIIESYADCAVRMKRYGLDGVEVHCAHSYLPGQFLSPTTNRREDQYGGTLENRAHFIMEVLTAVRAAVGSGFVVGVRLVPDLVVGGACVTDNLAVAQMLQAAGLIDYLNLSTGSYNSAAKMIGGMYEPTGYQMPMTAPIRSAMTLPMLVTGRYRTLEEAGQVIRDGEADMVGMVRAMIADPYLVTKSLAGKAEQVRPCIGCNQACVARAAMGIGIGCTVNAGAGDEAERGDHRLTPASVRKRVLVVGGGPAGMEAARVAALRGHAVTLVEASAKLGGAVRAAAKAPTRHNLIDIVTWLEAEIYRLGVDVRLSTYLDSSEVDGFAADEIIVATGSWPRMDGVLISHVGQPVRGVGQRHVLSSTDLFLAPPAELGDAAVVIDDVGHYEGLAAAEQLISKGLSVTYVTRLPMMAPMIQLTGMNEPFLQRMAGKPFRSLVRTRAIEIEAKAVVVGPAHLTSDEIDIERLAADTVVLVTSNRSNRDIYDELVSSGRKLQIIGDAQTPRSLEFAIREGYLAGAAP